MDYYEQFTNKNENKLKKKSMWRSKKNKNKKESQENNDVFNIDQCYIDQYTSI